MKCSKYIEKEWQAILTNSDSWKYCTDEEYESWEMKTKFELLVEWLDNKIILR